MKNNSTFALGFILSLAQVSSLSVSTANAQTTPPQDAKHEDFNQNSEKRNKEISFDKLGNVRFCGKYADEIINSTCEARTTALPAKRFFGINIENCGKSTLNQKCSIYGEPERIKGFSAPLNNSLNIFGCKKPTT